MHVSGPATQTHVLPSGDEVTMYWSMGDPPSSTGGVQPTTARPFAPVAMTEVGGLNGSGGSGSVAASTAAPASTTPAPQWIGSAGSLEQVKTGPKMEGGNG